MADFQEQHGDPKLQELAANYNRNYKQSNYFRYRYWLYRPFVKAIVKHTGLAKNSRLLDAGCGQGFFSSLFAECGMKVLGVDISQEGVTQAQRIYGSTGAEFVVGNIYDLPYRSDFDCVYTRSCSLYNRADFGDNRSVSNVLLRYVKPGGVLIFDYYTNLCPRKKSAAWLYHSMAAAKKHFSPFQDAKVFFLLRFDTIVLGALSFSLSGLDSLISRIGGIGGDLVAIVPKK